jgi:hypothetical protein
MVAIDRIEPHRLTPQNMDDVPVIHNMRAFVMVGELAATQCKKRHRTEKEG